MLFLFETPENKRFLEKKQVVFDTTFIRLEDKTMNNKARNMERMTAYVTKVNALVKKKKLK